MSPDTTRASAETAAGVRTAAAALLYFAVVFGVGFVLGPIRVLRLEPRFGQTIAVACESPFHLVAMAVAARWLPAAMRLPRKLKWLALMGLGALALQQAADIVVGIALRGSGPAAHLAYFATPAGLIYAGLLLLFAAMPALVNYRRPVGVRRPSAG